MTTIAADFDALDDVWLWVDQDGIRLVAAAPNRDQVLLTREDARRLARWLLDLANPVHGTAPLTSF